MGCLTIDGEQIFVVPKEVPSNKPKTKVVSTCKNIEEGTPEDYSYTPFIDRMSVILNIDDPELQQYLDEAHWAATQDKSVFMKLNPSKGFSRAFKLVLDSIPSSSHWPHYQYAIGEHGIYKVRIELIPKDLGPEGMYDLHACLAPILPDGWKTFIHAGKVTRIDIALDVDGLDMGDFMIMPPQCLNIARRYSKGFLHTVELGLPSGNQTCIYDRYQKRLAKGQGKKFGPCVRFERRLKGQVIALSDLPNLPNPFAHLEMVQPNLKRPALEKSLSKWEMFRHTALAVGQENALRLLNPKRRTMYKKHFKALKADWWDTQRAWANWPKALASSLVASEKAFV